MPPLARNHIIVIFRDNRLIRLFEFAWRIVQRSPAPRCTQRPINTPSKKLKPDDHSEVVPLLPIPNRTVKRLCADDSADSRVKVGHRQANIRVERPADVGRFYL